MENNSVRENLEIKPEILNYLDTTRKWTMFLAILGYISLGTFIIGGFITGIFISVFNTSQTRLTQWAIIVLFLATALVTFFALRYIFRFSKFMRHAIKEHDQQALVKAFRNLKSYYVYIGIVVIVILVIYVVTFIVAGASVALLNI